MLSIDKYPAEWPSSGSNHSSGESATSNVADYSVTQMYFLNKDPAAANYIHFICSDL